MKPRKPGRDLNENAVADLQIISNGIVMTCKLKTLLLAIFSFCWIAQGSPDLIKIIKSQNKKKQVAKITKDKSQDQQPKESAGS